MAILLNDNLDIAAVKPTDNRYGPYATVSAANSAISGTRRYIGLTVGIVTGGTVEEYWYKSGISDPDLVTKTASTAPVDLLAGLVTVDGSGSGLDADLLDGHDSTYFGTAADVTGKVSKSGDTITGSLAVTDNVGIGTAASATYKLEVNGSFAATTKSFLIDHPTKPDMKLRYGSLEGPENGVYVRGRIQGNFIDLPDYWTKLVNPLTISVSLTAIGAHQSLCVVDISNNRITIINENVLDQGIDCFYVVYGERSDVDSLVVEIPK